MVNTLLVSKLKAAGLNPAGVKSWSVVDPGGQSGHAPIQSDSMAINFEFDIRPRGLGLISGVFLSLH